MTTRHVIEDWTATYSDPISLEKGDEVWPSAKRENWGGHVWIWATNRAGKEGWVPDSIFERFGNRTYAKMAFCAQELTCRRGEEVFALDETHGWVLCRNADGMQGWVPAENLGEKSVS